MVIIKLRLLVQAQLLTCSTHANASIQEHLTKQTTRTSQKLGFQMEGRWGRRATCNLTSKETHVSCIQFQISVLGSMQSWVILECYFYLAYRQRPQAQREKILTPC